jgi:excisionase family DNA binding protein
MQPLRKEVCATQEHQFWTVPEVAKILRISRNRAYDLVARKQLSAIRIGRVLRVREADLRRFVEENRY